TTAELIAGAQGRQASTPAGRKSGAARIVLISVGVVAVVGAAAFFATRSRKPARPEEATGEDAVKAGDALFKQHKYLAAMEMYEKAGNSPAPNRKKAAEEAQGEEAYNSLRGAVAADDGDKARSLFDRCAADSTYWCRQAQEQGDQVRSAYAKKHLAAASAFKSAGKLDGCQTEASNVLAFDAANVQAQALQSECRPKETAKAEAAREEGAAPKERETKAARLAQSSSNKLVGRDFAGAVKDAQAALARTPKDKNTLMLAYRSLGYGYAYLNDKDVTRQHGRLVRESGHYYIEDLNSFTGIRVNGEKIIGKRLLHDGDLIQISEYDLILQEAPEERPPLPFAGIAETPILPQEA